jgi:hypothetical protein
VAFFMPQGIAGLFDQVKSRFLRIYEGERPEDVS